MIAKLYRFHGYNALRFVYSKGKTVRSRGVSLRYSPNSRRRDSRLAVVVSKKVAKKSPTRNRIRRRLYETTRLKWTMIEPGYDLVLTVFDQDAATMPSAKLSKIVDDLLAQAKVLKS